MSKEQQHYPLPGTTAYWQQLKDGYELIGKYGRALTDAERSPSYYGADMNEDGGARPSRKTLVPGIE